MGRLLATLGTAVTLLAAAGSAEASVWSAQLSGTSGGTAVNLGFQVTLPDPSGGTVVTLGGIPVGVAQDPGAFGISVTLTSQHGVCVITINAAGSGPKILAPTGETIAQFPLTGRQTISCPGTGSAPGSNQDNEIVITVTARRIDGTANSTVLAQRGRTTVSTPAGQQNIPLGGNVPTNVEISTGADGTFQFQAADGTLVTVNPNSRVALSDPGTGGLPVVNVVSGTVDIRPAAQNPGVSPATGATTVSPARTRRGAGTGPVFTVNGATGTNQVRTPLVGVQFGAADFTMTHTQSPSGGTVQGASTATVRSGTLEVTDRQNQRVTVAQGEARTFTGSIPRVVPVIPAERGEVTAGQTNTFVWTAFPGAANYLLEFTLNPNGFQTPNATGVENPLFTLRIQTGQFQEGEGVITFRFPVPTGVVAPGTQVRYRVFPANGSGQVLANTTSSDPFVITVR